MSDQTELAVIVAVADNGVIGRQNDLPWRLSADLQRFKALTMGCPMIMGRKTFQSLGRFLPGRQHLVISRQVEHSAWWPAETPATQGLVFADFPSALIHVQEARIPRVYVIGGRDLFACSLPLADRLYLTRVHSQIEGDVLMPEIDWSCWLCQESETFAADERNQYPYTFETYVRH